MSFTVSYNNITDRAVGCHAAERPSIPAPVQDVQAVSVPGRDGKYYYPEGTYGDIVIPIRFSFTDRNPDHWAQQYRAIKSWLLSRQTGELRFSDDSLVHYRVKSVRITSTERVTWKIGVVTAEFVCDGYTYLNSGDAYIALAGTISNAYAMCKPIYRVTGSGRCVLTVNGNEFVIEVNSSTTIDTERFVSFNTSSGTLANTTVTGDYQDLWLLPGDNSLSITSGFTCEIMPQWRCL